MKFSDSLKKLSLIDNPAYVAAPDTEPDKVPMTNADLAVKSNLSADRIVAILGDDVPTRAEVEALWKALCPAKPRRDRWHFLYLAGYWPEGMIGIASASVVDQVYLHVFTSGANAEIDNI